MSIVARASKNVSAAAATAARAPREPSEFDGFWLNAGVTMAGETEADNKFVRLPRGIAVSDLQPGRIYSTMDPDYAAQVTLVNNIIATIQNACKNMEEGASKPIKLDVVLYRRQEEAEVETSKNDVADLTATLFGA